MRAELAELWIDLIIEYPSFLTTSKVCYPLLGPSELNGLNSSTLPQKWGIVCNQNRLHGENRFRILKFKLYQSHRNSSANSYLLSRPFSSSHTLTLSLSREINCVFLQ